MLKRYGFILAIISLIKEIFDYFKSIKKKPVEDEQPKEEIPEDIVEEIKSEPEPVLPPLSKKIVVIDCGHGGINPFGYYTTQGKRFRHQSGTFHNGSWFYEGVWNRQQGKRLAKLFIDNDIRYEFVNHDYLDTPLKERSDRANELVAKYGVENVLYISLHADALDTKARGFSVFTSRGITPSDKIAEHLYSEVENNMGHLIRVRYDLEDGYKDFEANFHVLARTKCSAILIEHLFFDNLKDAELLMDNDICDLFAISTLNTVKAWIEEKID